MALVYTCMLEILYDNIKEMSCSVNTLMEDSLLTFVRFLLVRTRTKYVF